MSARWRSDDVARRFSTSTIGDDVARCDELARTTFMGWVYRRLINRECLGLESGNLPGGFLCFGGELALFWWGE